MQLSNSLISRFKVAFKEAYGKDLSDEQAEAELLSLAELIELIRLKPTKAEVSE